MPRPAAYPLLIACGAVLFLVNLGAPSLWDVDEGNNAEAAREMFMSGDWVVPTFNYRLRPDKPALLYWLQASAYAVFGVNEFSARLPSALASIVTMLLAYELGRAMFGAGTAILSGLVVGSTVMVAGAAHFANPDALLNVCTVAELLFFWRAVSTNDARWFIPAGVAAGFGVLAKGPVAVALPGSVALMFLAISGRLRVLADRRLIGAVAACLLVALPWYIWVGADTKGEWLRGFFFTHNIGRFSAPMEGHRGPVYYYLVCLVVGFAPWSVILLPASRHAWTCARKRPTDPDTPDRRHAIRFLALWTATYLAFFSVSATKLPNYILPVAVPLAILTALYVADWRRGVVTVARWEGIGIISGCVVTGLVLALAMLLASGRIGGLKGTRAMPGVELVAFAGLIPALAGLGLACLARRGARLSAIISCTAAAVAFVATLGGWGAVVVDWHKAARPLVTELLASPPDAELRIACYEFSRPSVVFYSRREVQLLDSNSDAVAYLLYPMPSYLLCPESTWDSIRTHLPAARVVQTHWDLYRGAPVVLIANR